MAHSQDVVQSLYKKLLALYPRRFRERLEESMQQTFNDLFKERQAESAWFGFILWIFVETGMGIFREHVYAQGNAMKNIASNPNLTALISFILCLPLAVPFVLLMADVKPLIDPLTNLLTVDGQQINNLGRIVFLGGLLLLPAAFMLNLQPMLVRTGPEGRRTLHKVNLILAAAILLLITFTWGSLLMDQIYCLQGIRCD